MTAEEYKIIEIGGARLDTFYVTWPFAKLSATKQRITLECFSKQYQFEKNRIIGIREYKGLFSKGLLIQHDIADYPHHIVFWVFDFQNFKKQIEVLGYSVGLPRKSDAWWRGGP